MKCKKVESLLIAYLNNETNHLQNNEVNEHIQSCSSCKKKLSDYKMILDLKGVLSKSKIPEYLKRSVQSTFRRMHKKDERSLEKKYNKLFCRMKLLLKNVVNCI